MEKWTELRSAYLVAKLGTVSAAADALGVHRATVNRHIDALEYELGAKLFHRHGRGYTPTEAGKDMLETASRVEEMFNGLAGRTLGTGNPLSGKLIINALPTVSSLIMPAITGFRNTHPEVDIQFDAEYRLVRLEYGEAHVAIRAGAKPEDPDYVVQPYRDIHFCLYAHKDYLEQHNYDEKTDDLNGHLFVGTLNAETKLPYTEWFNANVSADAIALHAHHSTVILNGVLSGLGIGFLPDYTACKYADLIQVIPERKEWTTKLWIVTHVDLHRTEKIQEFIQFLKSDQ